MNVKAVLFDFDGTLFELKVDWDRLRQELKDLLRFPGPASEFKPLRPRIQAIVKDLANGKEIEQKAYDIISQHETRGAEEGYPHEGAKEILEWCQEQDIRTVILSRNTKYAILPVIERYRWPQPNLIIAREDVKNEKPNPEAGLLVLEKLQLRKEDCLIIGDSLPDLEMAKNLGIKSVLYHNPRHQFIPKDQADYFIKNLLEIKEIVCGNST